MGAESLVDESPVTLTRKPDKVEALDVSLLDSPMKEISDFASTVVSPDSVLSVGPKEKSSEVRNELASKLAVESFTFDAFEGAIGSDNVDTGMSTSTEVTSKVIEREVEAETKLNSSGVTGVALREILPMAVEIKEDKVDEASVIINKNDALEVTALITQASSVDVSIAHEIQEMEEISLEEDGEKKTPVKNGMSMPGSQPGMDNSKLVDSNKQTAPISKEISKSVRQLSTAYLDAVKRSATVHKEDLIIEAKPSTTDLKFSEGDVKEDALVTTEAAASELQPVIAENPVAESQVKTESFKAVERTEREDKLAVLAASAIESLPTSRFARASEIQEAAEPATPPASERSGTVIRLTRQMSRVSHAGMGPISPRFEIRAAKEIQDLQEKVKSLEEELRRKSAVIDTQNFNHKEKESELLNKIECLELANEQLLQGGNDSSIQLQMELTRLQRQNSVLQLRERELQFQINTQEMIKTQMLDKKPANADQPTNPTKQLESKVAILESKLAEAVEVSNMYKIQLHEAFTRQKSVQSAALLNLGDGEDVLKELQKLRKQTKEQEAELVDLQDRFFIISVRLAEAAAQKEELLSKLKRIQGLKSADAQTPLQQFRSTLW